MKASILHLEDYVFTDSSVTCEFRDNWPDGPIHLEVNDIEFDIQCMDPNESDPPTLKTIRVKIKNAEEDSCETCYYKFVFEALLRIDFREKEHGSKYDKVAAERILVINATNLLYGAIRERLRSTTSSMLWGSIVLPLVTFDGLSKLVQAGQSSDIEQEELKPNKTSRKPK